VAFGITWAADGINIGLGDNDIVEKVIRVFQSLKEADEADARTDANLSPKQRLDILLELRNRRDPDAAKQGLARVCREKS
jgi:hypothetical protein